jgi:hypothetical protein
MATPQTEEQIKRKKEYDLHYNKTLRVVKMDKEKNKVAAQKYREKNRELIRQREKEKYRSNIHFNVVKRLRSRLQNCIKGKRPDFQEVLQCDISFLTTYFEYQFDETMSWENKGQHWDIDHVIPLKHFDLSRDDHVKVCFHWSNLRPCPKKENQAKSAKIDFEIIQQQANLARKFAEANATSFLDIFNWITNTSKDGVQQTML